jgi:hypothetical protein
MGERSMNTRLLASAAILTLAASGAAAQMPAATPSPAQPPAGASTPPPAPAPAPVAATPAAAPAAAPQRSPTLHVTAQGPRNPVRHAAQEPSYREGFSVTASNIIPSDTHSVIAPHLPVPRLAPGAGPPQFLRVADYGLQTGRTGLAQEAMERAETRLLDRVIIAPDPVQPDTSPPVVTIAEGRQALGQGDIPRAEDHVLRALTMVESGTGS